MQVVRRRGRAGQEREHSADRRAGGNAPGRGQEREPGGPLRPAGQQFAQGSRAGAGGERHGDALQRATGGECQEAVRGGEDEAAGQAHQDRQHQGRAASDVVGPVTGQDEGGHERQDVGGERHRDVERRDAEFCLQQGVQRRRKIRADEQRENHDAGHHEPCGGGSVPAPAVSCGRAHAEFTEDCHGRALAKCRPGFPCCGGTARPGRRLIPTECNTSDLHGQVLCQN